MNPLQKLNMILVLVLLTLIAVQTEFHYKEVDPELSSYVVDYYKLLNEYCPKHNYNTTKFYTIQFVNKLPGYEIGVCYRLLNGYKIEINREWWSTENSVNKRQLMYHELAHCVINKDHVSDFHNYMFADFFPIKYQSLNDQVKLDIINYCK